MKSTKTIQSTIQCIALTVAAATHSAETLITSRNATNSIVVATNEAVILDHVVGTGEISFRRQPIASQVSFTRGSAFAGPCELAHSSGILTFRRIQTPNITTIVIGANETNAIIVPTNKTLRIFPTLGGGIATIGNDVHSIDLSVNENFRTTLEMAGPLTMKIVGSGNPSAPSSAFSYCLTEDFLQLTAEGYIRAPTGTFEILVEKSTDLTKWLPVMVQNTATADTRAFYRLRIQK